MTEQIAPVTRIQQNLLARSERRLIDWICPRLPAKMMPDHLTAIGMIGAFIIALGYFMSRHNPAWLWLSVGAYFVHWFGDSLDGSLARWRKIERPRFGYFIDHSMDALASLMIVGGLGLSPYVRLDVALLALAGYYMLAIHAFLKVRVLGEMNLTYAAAGPTELRIILIALTIAMWWTGWTAPGPGGSTPFDYIVGAVATILIILFVLHTGSTSRRLLNEGEAPRDLR